MTDVTTAASRLWLRVRPCGDAVAQPVLLHRDLAAELVSLARLLLEYSVAPRLGPRETLVEEPGDPAGQPYGGARCPFEPPAGVAAPHMPDRLAASALSL